MGGKFLFLLAIAGIILTVLKKDRYGRRDVKYAILLTIWFIGTAYGFTKGMRFAILMVPAFAIALGVGVGVIYEYSSKWITKELHIQKYITKTLIVVLLLLLLFSPLKAAANVAKNEIPSMNDAWYDSLTAIKEDNEDAITTSWWDFGHWFVAISERRVTFDGADQGERIHWVGKSLLTEDEDTAVGILRMLNCGQEKAPHVLEGYLDNDTVKAIDVLNEIILEDKKEAGKTLEDEGLSDDEIEDVLAVTHCDDLIPQYYIASEDMIGKASVWGHFGSWDFKKAKMWQTVRGEDVVEGTRILREEFGLSEEDADNIYYEIQNNLADRWVSPWPGYLSGLSGCSERDEIIACGNGLEVDLTNNKALVSVQQGKAQINSLAFVNNKGEFEIIRYEGETAPISAALIPSGDGAISILMDPLLAGSMFTRMFFFDGHGLEHFSLFSDKRQTTGGRIQVWKVSWEGGEPINIFEEEIVNEVEDIEEEINEENNTNSTRKEDE
jgi:dolichyl-diphosphooligosaccharide--protein glycosyltransferase